MENISVWMLRKPLILEYLAVLPEQQMNLEIDMLV